MISWTGLEELVGSKLDFGGEIVVQFIIKNPN